MAEANEFEKSPKYVNEFDMSSKDQIVSQQPGKEDYQHMQTIQPQQDGTGNILWAQEAAGLDSLAGLDHVLLRQKIEVIQAVTGFETRNRYDILNDDGQRLLRLEEEPGDWGMRFCCGPGRRFTIWVYDQNDQPILKLWRPFRCCAGCSWCASCDSCQQEIIVETPEGERFGNMQHQCSCCYPIYNINDGTGDKVYDLKGKCCICLCPCCLAWPYKIWEAATGSYIGEITKFWDGCLRMCCTVADSYAVYFPADMDVKQKALILGSAILVDFQYYEYQGNN